MLRRILVPVTALALAGVVAGASPAGAVTRTFTTVMTGAEERTLLGDPDGIGIARFTINTATDQICFVMRVSGIEPAFAAHIHRAPRGAAGGVVVPLPAPTRGRSAGCVTDADADAIAANPALYYVNVHNAPYPGGALRGQLA